jgi:hypothetical protein
MFDYVTLLQMSLEELDKFSWKVFPILPTHRNHRGRKVSDH